MKFFIPQFHLNFGIQNAAKKFSMCYEHIENVLRAGRSNLLYMIADALKSFCVFFQLTILFTPYDIFTKHLLKFLRKKIILCKVFVMHVQVKPLLLKEVFGQFETYLTLN